MNKSRFFVFVTGVIITMLFFGALAACAPAVTSIPTETRSSTLIPTPTFSPATETPSPVPTDPVSLVITPDPIQVERWKEYENALGEKIVKGEKYVLCEWETLGEDEQKLYVWAVCNGVSVPAVIYLNLDGSIQKVDIPGMNSDWSSDILKMFPVDVREKFQYMNESVSKMLAHIEWRRTHPEEPPLIVLSSTPMP